VTATLACPPLAPAPAPIDGLTIRRATFADDDAIVATIAASFGVDRTPAWFRWKHCEGPWGPSRGWVAEAGDGTLAGVRLFLPWQLRSSGTTVDIVRAVDGAVVPQWRRRGVFERLLRAEIDHIGPEGRPLIYSTPVPASSEAHRKLGWATLDPIPQVATAVLPRLRDRARLELDGDLGGSAPAGDPADHRLQTAWSAASLGWRLQPASGHGYRIARLVQDDHDAAVVVRRATNHGVPVAVVVHQHGDAAGVRRVVRAVATAWRTPLVLGLGDDVLPGARHQVASSVVTVLPGTAPLPLDPRLRSSWRFGLADLEGVI
jgi:hypothetical protein